MNTCGEIMSNKIQKNAEVNKCGYINNKDNENRN